MRKLVMLAVAALLVLGVVGGAMAEPGGSVTLMERGGSVIWK